jgi:hypothetical protein
MAAAVTAAGVAVVHCDQSTTTETYTPITGIEISAAALTAGHGCSNSPQMPNAVYRYSAVVTYVYEGGLLPGDPNQPTAAVFECYADGYFENLPVDAGGNQAFSIAIAAWNVAGFPAVLTPCTAEPTADAGVVNACPAEQVPVVLDGGGVSPQWTTTCTAYMQPNIPAIASCAPLVPFVAGSSAPEGGSSDAAGGDAGAVDGESPPDASADVAPEASPAAADASDATSGD